METEKFKELLKKYSEGKTTDEENYLLECWYETYSDKRELPLFEQAGKEEAIGKEIYRSVRSYWHPNPVKTIWRKQHLLKYAAAIAFIFLSATLSWYIAGRTTEQFISYSSKEGTLKKVILPDGSHVWLNSASTMHVSVNFSTNKLRQVYLDEGEAFFEVEKNRSRPFIVHSDNISTKVLGTSFNIRAYKDLPEIKVAVAAGQVEVSDKESRLALLTPEKQVRYNRKSGLSKIEYQTSAQSNAWREGRIYLKDAGFAELALVIKNIYGSELLAGNKDLHSYRYSLQINTSRTLEKTLKIICSIHQNQFRRKDNAIEIY